MTCAVSSVTVESKSAAAAAYEASNQIFASLFVGIGLLLMLTAALTEHVLM